MTTIPLGINTPTGDFSFSDCGTDGLGTIYRNGLNHVPVFIGGQHHPVDEQNAEAFGGVVECFVRLPHPTLAQVNNADGYGYLTDVRTILDEWSNAFGSSQIHHCTFIAGNELATEIGATDDYQIAQWYVNFSHLTSGHNSARHRTTEDGGNPGW